MSYVDLSELEFEKEFIEYLTRIGGVRQWEYREDIKTTQKLWENFMSILERNNQSRLEDPLSKAEFAQVKREIEKLDTPFKAGQFLYGTNGVSQIEITLDNGKHIFLTVFDQSQIGSGDTVYQIVNQIERPRVIDGKQNRRFDVTLLINGLPIIQIELKKSVGTAIEALNQMEQYIAERQYSDIYSTLQILVAMTPYDIKYMSNTTADNFNRDFAFSWQTEDSKQVTGWRDFSDRVLSIPMAHELSTRYMILDATKGKESIKVMRPFQVYATKKALDKIMNYKFNNGGNKLGYIWHTTGSGKTITSFKTAWLASRISHIDKVIFLVDRIALTNQTADAYKAYDPTAVDGQGGVVADTATTNVLAKKIASKSIGSIIVTSIQKMAILVKRKNFKEPKQNILFIVDEAHRSTSEGDVNHESMLQAIRKILPSAAWIGYTGTPRFDGNTTNKVFGDLLHAYSIKEAIKDKNVLGFKVEFKETIPTPEVTEEEWGDKYKRSIYDTHQEHVKLVVHDILKNWNSRSANGQYNALLSVGVGQGSSVPRVMEYFNEFLKQMDERPASERIKIAVSFSMDTTNSKYQLDTNNSLHKAIDYYNEMFGTSFEMNTVKEYTEDLASRLNKSAEDKNYLDLVIVIEQFLTGFDAVELNTLYLDRMIGGLSLIQAYSRTNRIHRNDKKPHGNIVHYRWPEQSEERMNKAFSIYADVRNALGIDSNEDFKSIVFAKPYLQLHEELAGLIRCLREQTQEFSDLPAGENEKLNLYEDLKAYNRLLNQIKQHPYDEKTNIGFDDENKGEFYDSIGMTLEEEVKLTNVIAPKLKEYIAHNEQIEVAHVDLSMAHIQEVRINYSYLRELIADIANDTYYNQHHNIEEAKEKVLIEINKIDNEKLRDELIWFINEIVSKRYEFSEYPVKGLEKIVNDGLTEAKKKNNLGLVSEFILDWGLVRVVSKEGLLSMLSKHKKGEDDLDRQGEMTGLMNKAKDDYKVFAREDIAEQSWIKYRKFFRRSIKNLADEIVDRM